MVYVAAASATPTRKSAFEELPSSSSMRKEPANGPPARLPPVVEDTGLWICFTACSSDGSNDENGSNGERGEGGKYLKYKRDLQTRESKCCHPTRETLMLLCSAAAVMSMNGVVYQYYFSIRHQLEQQKCVF